MDHNFTKQIGEWLNKPKASATILSALCTF